MAGQLQRDDIPAEFPKPARMGCKYTSYLSTKRNHILNFMTTTHEQELRDTAQKIVDLFFDAGARVSQTHYDYVLEKLSSHLTADRQRVVEAIQKSIGEDIKGNVNLPSFPQAGKMVVEHINQERQRIRQALQTLITPQQ
jgi:hypothetical protein